MKSRNKISRHSGFRKISLNSLLLSKVLFLIFLSSCEGKDTNDGFRADFSYEFTDDNHVMFSNESEGEYYSLSWDFGNGEEVTNTEKRKTYTIYYPLAGDYEVTLKILDYDGNTKSVTKTISILTSDLVISFSAEIDPVNPNLVILKNTTQGVYDSFKWIYRDKEVINEIETVAYFPYAGKYDVELQVFNKDKNYILKKNVIIVQDDPLYIANMTLVWSDEFNGSSINTSDWTFETGANGWGNSELQNYTNTGNAEIVEGKLIITARKVDDNQVAGSYTSARMISEGKREFRYGRIEIRAKLPSGRGIWPAIWMLGGNFRTVGWPACGEMDIMEYVGYQPNVVHSTVHTPSGFGGNGSGSSKILSTIEEEFHIYGLIWTEKELIFYTDTPENITYTYAPAIKTASNWPFDQTAFFILNVAVGGTWGGAQGIDNAIFPQSMEIDYVRVYQ